MKRLLLLALWLPCAAFAQYTINVSVTYTPAAAQAAINAGTTVPAKMDQLLSGISGNYANMTPTIGVTYVPISIPARGAPSDSEPMSAQYSWVKNSPIAWQNRTNAEASISIHVSDTPGATGAVIAANQPASASESVIAIPYALLDSTLDAAIARVMGGTTGYSKRMRSYPTDPQLAGQNYCYHTRESGPSNASELVPFLPYWVAYGSGSVEITQTQSASPAVTCEAYRLYGIASLSGWNTTNHHSSRIIPTNQCQIMDINGTTVSANGNIVYNANPGSSTIACAETGFSVYSINGNMWFPPYLPLGTAATDTVARINARAPAVYNFTISNGSILARTKEGPLSAVCRWITCPF